MKATLLSILLSAVTLIRAAAGNDGLNILQAEYSKPGVAESFVAGKAWFPFPAYEDRAGWAALFGPDAEKVIRRGESCSTTNGSTFPPAPTSPSSGRATDKPWRGPKGPTAAR